MTQEQYSAASKIIRRLERLEKIKKIVSDNCEIEIRNNNDWGLLNADSMKVENVKKIQGFISEVIEDEILELNKKLANI